MKFLANLIAITLLFYTTIAYAEGGCPPRMIPYSATNTSSCGPIPNYGQSSFQEQSGPRWITTWGAISTGTGATGLVTGLPDKRSAKKEAIQKCQKNGGQKCKIELTYHNQCAALVAGDKGHNSYSAATIEEATKLAINFCRKTGDEKCEVFLRCMQSSHANRIIHEKGIFFKRNVAASRHL